MPLESDPNRYDDDVDERRAIMEAEGVQGAKWRGQMDAMRALWLEMRSESVKNLET